MALVLRVTAATPLSSSRLSTKMALRPTSSNKTTSNVSFTSKKGGGRKLPILLFDIMDTIVRDPFYHDIPNFFGMSFEELIECKDPTAWIEFEKGFIDEIELSKKFFKDGRPFDLEGLKNCMSRGYSYMDGVEDLLCDLKQNNYEMHAFTNYPNWHTMIEEKLNVSTYLSWMFCSSLYGKRKPDPAFYLEVLRNLKVDPTNCIFVDDRQVSFPVILTSATTSTAR
ncbi:catalytic, putative [Ricinus communis]|uniref:Catalytic, putative n=1 Tax=Ricinus communis TaxID=3988 RepID=B9S274_RICCO|nr:catalytic, putative [Ricinus communis]